MLEGGRSCVSQFHRIASAKAMDVKEFQFYKICGEVSYELGMAVLSGYKPAEALRKVAELKNEAVVYHLLEMDHEYLEQLLSCAAPEVGERLMVRLPKAEMGVRA